ncbi:MAG: fatty acid--CoA ligase family protein, partial [Actinobacteria bacterium]|nr:fatty acid--CoA ligase family protein [Actinomycetota bacterium]
VPRGEIGEIAFRAAAPVRYWRRPPVATSGWYHTGDLGRIDDDGRVFVLGRLKQVVNRGGLKVSPGEVEVAMVRHPGVADAAVIATPDPVLGEATCACVVASDGDPPDLDELRSFLGTSLARHKLPDELCVVDAIPRTPIGKIDRPALERLVVGGDRPRERLRPR